MAEFITRLRDIARDDSDDGWSRFNTILDELSVSIRKIVNVPESTSSSRNKKSVNPDNHKDIQQLYRRNIRKAIQTILGEVNKECYIPIDDITSTFAQDASIGVNLEDIPPHPSLATTPVDLTPFLPSEVAAKLHKAEKSAPGTDRITYNHWRGVDPDAKVLILIMNICIKENRIPDAWEKSTTILILKCIQPKVAKDYRPIALTPTVYRLFAGLLSRRLSVWLEEGSIITPSQKGFMPHDGTF